jgi:DNA-binding CsgD family transcriptional regulator
MRRKLASEPLTHLGARHPAPSSLSSVPSPAVAEVRIDAGARGLTQRQRQVLSLLLGGAAEKEIAAGLGISQHTTHSHIKAIYRHLRVSSRAQRLDGRRAQSSLFSSVQKLRGRGSRRIEHPAYLAPNRADQAAMLCFRLSRRRLR